MLEIRPYLKVYINHRTKEVIISRPITDKDNGLIYELTDIGYEIFLNLDKPISLKELEIRILTKFPYGEQEFEGIIQFLFSEKIITIKKELDHINPQLVDQYDR
ncbi:hypothetical protein V1498_06995 [Peribacillus sp. SCS-26]|uniref:hypothetical protein n=1 Tax=Paraperibacillus marinus TaxID=3115295 RepID=UPI003905FDCA